MARSHLLDTIAIKRLGSPEVRTIVDPLALAGEAARCAISDLDLGFSARTQTEWHALIEALDGFWMLPTTADHVRRALRVKRLLASRSQWGRKLPDLLTAAAAEELDLTVFLYARDFDLIAAVAGQRCRWVVPAGSVD